MEIDISFMSIVLILLIVGTFMVYRGYRSAGPTSIPLRRIGTMLIIFTILFIILALWQLYSYANHGYGHSFFVHGSSF